MFNSKQIVLLVLLASILSALNAQSMRPANGKTYIIDAAVGGLQALSSESPHSLNARVQSATRLRGSHQPHIHCTLEYAGHGYYLITGTGGQLALELKDGNRNAGATLWLQERKPRNLAQHFKLEHVRYNQYRIFPRLNRDMRLTMRRGSNQPGTVVELRRKDVNSAAQRWNLEYVKRQSNYKIFLESINCAAEDDPGKEVEVYGNVQAIIKKKGREIARKTLFERDRRNPVEIRRRSYHYVRESMNIELDNGEVERGDYVVELLIRMYEKDNTSADENFFGEDQLGIGTVLKNKIATRIQTDGTVLVLYWRTLQEDPIH